MLSILVARDIDIELRSNLGARCEVIGSIIMRA